MENPSSRKLLLSTLGEEIEQAARWLSTLPEADPSQIKSRIQALREAAVVIGAQPVEKQLLELERSLLGGKPNGEQLSRALYQLARILGELELQQAGLILGWLEPFEETLKIQQQARKTLEHHLENLQKLIGVPAPGGMVSIITNLLEEAHKSALEVKEAQDSLLRARDGLCRLLAESTRASLAPLFASLREAAGKLFLEKGRPGALLIESAGLRLPVELLPPLEKVLYHLVATAIESLSPPPRGRSRHSVATVVLRQSGAAGLVLFELYGDELQPAEMSEVAEKLQSEMTFLRARLSLRRDPRCCIRLSVASWPGLEEVLEVDCALGPCWLRVAALESLSEANGPPAGELIGPATGIFKHQAAFLWEGKQYYFPIGLRQAPRWVSIKPPPAQSPYWLCGETNFGQPVLHPWPWLPMGENETCVFPRSPVA